MAVLLAITTMIVPMMIVLLKVQSVFVTVAIVHNITFMLCLVSKIEEGKIGCGWKVRKPKIVPQFGSREQLKRKESNVEPCHGNLSVGMWGGKDLETTIFV